MFELEISVPPLYRRGPVHSILHLLQIFVHSDCVNPRDVKRYTGIVDSSNHQRFESKLSRRLNKLNGLERLSSIMDKPLVRVGALRRGSKPALP